MAFLGAPLRWPDALPVSLDFEGLAGHVRPYLPRPLDTLPSPFIASAFVTWILVTAITIFSATMNQRRMVLAPPHAEKAAARRSARGQKSTALLLGPEQTGKSAIFSALSMKTVPETKTTQQENGCMISLAYEGASTLDEKTPSSKSVVLWDLPGHPRLRAKADAFLPKADKLIFCVDATSAIRGGTSRNDNLVDAVDQLHAVLTSLARLRLSRSSRSTSASSAPSLLVVFTRADLSPLLAPAPNDAKRQAQILSRARAALESELGKRRAGMGLDAVGATGRAKVGGMSRVMGGPASGSSSGGWWGSLKSIFGLSSGGGGSSTAGAGARVEEDEDEDDEALDYVDWTWAAERAQAATSAKGAAAAAATTFSLDNLDAEVIWGGKAEFAVASVGKERGWEEGTFQGLDALRRWLADAEHTADS